MAVLRISMMKRRSMKEKKMKRSITKWMRKMSRRVSLRSKNRVNNSNRFSNRSFSLKKMKSTMKKGMTTMCEIHLIIDYSNWTKFMTLV